MNASKGEGHVVGLKGRSNGASASDIVGQLVRLDANSPRPYEKDGADESGLTKDAGDENGDLVHGESLGLDESLGQSFGLVADAEKEGDNVVYVRVNDINILKSKRIEEKKLR